MRERKEKRKHDEIDVDWRVEQKLAPILAARANFLDGFIYGFAAAALFAYLFWTLTEKDKI